MSYIDMLNGMEKPEGWSEQKFKVYKALEKWATRLNLWEYAIQIKRRHRRKLDSFSPNSTSLEIIEKNKAMQRNEITPEEAMSILSEPSVRAELNACIDAGF